MILFSFKIETSNAFLTVRQMLVMKSFKNRESIVTCNPTILLTTVDILAHSSRLFFVVIAQLCLIFLSQMLSYSCVIDYFQLIQCGHLSVVVNISA